MYTRHIRNGYAWIEITNSNGKIKFFVKMETDINIINVQKTKMDFIGILLREKRNHMCSKYNVDNPLRIEFFAEYCFYICIHNLLIIYAIH